MESEVGTGTKAESKQGATSINNHTAAVAARQRPCLSKQQATRVENCAETRVKEQNEIRTWWLRAPILPGSYISVQRYLAHKKMPTPLRPHQAYGRVLGGCVFLQVRYPCTGIPR